MRTKTFLFFVNLALCLGVASSARLAAEVFYWPLPGSEQAKQRAESIHCVNNLLHTVRAAQAWANDSQDKYPTNLQSFALDLAQLAPTETVRCPSNHRYPPATNWVNFDWSTVDYEWVLQPNWNDPAAVCCRCLVHLNEAYEDGHVAYSQRFRGGWPAVFAGPLSQEATPGSEVEFRIGLAPDAITPVSYQWRRERLSYVTNVIFVGDVVSGDGYWITNRRANFTASALDGQTNAQLLFTNVQPADSDCYSVAISNRMGVAVSSLASLLVDDSVWSKITNQYWSAVSCVNNLRQICFLGRLWAGGHQDQMPPNLAVMTNAYGSPLFGWPVVLFCRADPARSVPPDWAGVNLEDTSYEVFPVGAEDYRAIFCRCKFHGFHAHADGRVVFQPNFTMIRPQANNMVELAFTVFRGQTNLLEVSPDLVNWTTLRTCAGTNGSFQLLATNDLPRKFYRIRTE